jgi:hypothetical protein
VLLRGAEATEEVDAREVGNRNCDFPGLERLNLRRLDEFSVDELHFHLIEAKFARRPAHDIPTLLQCTRGTRFHTPLQHGG